MHSGCRCKSHQTQKLIKCFCEMDLKLFISNNFGSSHLTVGISNFSYHLAFSVFHMILVENFNVASKDSGPYFLGCPDHNLKPKEASHNLQLSRLFSTKTPGSTYRSFPTFDFHYLKKNQTTATQNLLSQTFHCNT
jgi:hypothetical protein